MDAHVSHLFSEPKAENSIAAAQQIARQLVKGKGLPRMLAALSSVTERKSRRVSSMKLRDALFRELPAAGRAGNQMFAPQAAKEGQRNRRLR